MSQPRFLIALEVAVMYAILFGPTAISAETSCESQRKPLYGSHVEVTTVLGNQCMESIGYVSVLEDATPVASAPSKLIDSGDRPSAAISDHTLNIQIYSSVRLPDYLRISIYSSASNSLRSPIGFYECFGEKIIYTDVEPMCNLRYVDSDDQRSMELSFELDGPNELANCTSPDHCNLLVEAVWLAEPVLRAGTDHQWWQLPFTVK
jgi:hypothetical protein